MDYLIFLLGKGKTAPQRIQAPLVPICRGPYPQTGASLGYSYHGDLGLLQAGVASTY